LDVARPPQIPDHCGACEGDFDALERRIEHRAGGLIALHDALVRSHVLFLIMREEMLGVMVVDRGAQVGIRCGHLAVALRGFLCKSFVPRCLFTPDLAPILPALDARAQSLQIIRIHTCGKIARSVVGENKSDGRIVCHKHPR
jgi:hypothetical protein